MRGVAQKGEMRWKRDGECNTAPGRSRDDIRQNRMVCVMFRRGVSAIIKDAMQSSSARAGRPEMDPDKVGHWWSDVSETEILTSRSAKLGLSKGQ